jgi:hypothetical protein
MPEIDWSTAEVQDGTLTVELSDDVPEEWSERIPQVVGRLGVRGAGEVEVEGRRITVSDVHQGAEPEIRQALEGAVLQAAADHPPPEPDEEGEDGEDGGRSDADQAMTEAFRAFAG